MRHVQYAKYLQKIKQNEPEESKYVSFGYMVVAYWKKYSFKFITKRYVNIFRYWRNR